MQHTDSQNIDTPTLVFLKNPMYARVRMAVKDGLNALGGLSLIDVCDHQRNLREIYGFPLCRQIEYACVIILSQITQRSQINAASLLHLFRRCLYLYWFMKISCSSLG